MDNYNTFLLNGTLDALRYGHYPVSGKEITLTNDATAFYQAEVLLPDAVHAIIHDPTPLPARVPEGCQVSFVNTDSLSMAFQQKKMQSPEDKPPLVLNFANSVHPGGGVRKGASAQEEDLCRKSSLLLSLESGTAVPYYRYHHQLHTNNGSDAVILSPYVEVIRDAAANFMAPWQAAVITCAAPMLVFDDPLPEGYEDLMEHRMLGILCCAARWGYTDLVLGAWGCGAFAHDAADVAALFAKVLRTMSCGGQNARTLFRRIDFAVLGAPDSYNVQQFRQQFDHFQW